MSTHPFVETGVANSKHWQTLVNLDISNNGSASGQLEGVGVAQGHQAQHWVKIELDGTQVAREKLCTSKSDCSNVGVHIGLPFKNKLKIEVKEHNNPQSGTRFWASYLYEV